MIDGLINLGLVWLLKTKLLLEKSSTILNPVKWMYMKIVDIWPGKIGVNLTELWNLVQPSKCTHQIEFSPFFFQVSSTIELAEWCSKNHNWRLYQSQKKKTFILVSNQRQTRFFWGKKFFLSLSFGIQKNLRHLRMLDSIKTYAFLHLY